MNIYRVPTDQKKYRNFTRIQKKYRNLGKYEKSTEIGHLVQKKYRNLPFSAAKSTEIRQFNDIFW